MERQLIIPEVRLLQHFLQLRKALTGNKKDLVGRMQPACCAGLI